MTIKDSNDKFNLDYINSISEFIEILPNFKETIGDHGGRRYIYGGENICLNDIYKKLDSLVSSNINGILTLADQNNATKALDIIDDLDKKGTLLLKDKTQTSKYQRFTTFFRQLIGNRSYKRTEVHDKIHNIVENETREKENSAHQKISEFINLNIKAMTRAALDKLINDHISDHVNPNVSKNLLHELAHYIICDKQNSQFVLENLDRFQIDPKTPEGQKVVVDLVKQTYDRYKSPDKTSAKYRLNENIDYLKALFSDLHSCGYTNSIPGMKTILLEFVDIHGYLMKKENLENFGLDPQADQEAFIGCLRDYMDLYKINNPIFAFFYLISFTISPHQNAYVLQCWKDLLIQGPTPLIPTINDVALDPNQDDQLQTYIELLKVCKNQAPTSLNLTKLESITGLNGNSLQEWKILTTIIREISNEGEADKNIWEFIKAKSISGIPNDEREYLEWLIGKKLTDFNLFGSQDVFQALPTEVLVEGLDNFDSRTLAEMILKPFTKSAVDIAWITLLGRDRSKIKHNDLRDLTKLLSPISIIQKIQKYGPLETPVISRLRKLDLTGVIYASNGEQQQRELREALIGLLQSCPYLEDLTLPTDILIDDDIIAAMPKTLKKLTLENCKITSSCLKNLPLRVGTLVLRDVKFSAFPVEISPHLLVLHCEKMSFSIDQMINLPGDLIEFSFRKWNNKFTELKPLLPPHLKKLNCCLSETFTEEVSHAIPSNLEEFDISLLILEKENPVKLPPCIKRLEIFPGNWDGTFDELVDYLPSQLKFFTYMRTGENHFNLGKLPQNLEKFKLLGFSRLEKEMFEDTPAPDNIKTFEIHAWRDSLQNLVSLLPKNIVHLILNTSISDADIQYLPQSLKKLTVRKGCKDVTEEGIKSIKMKGIILDTIF